jgi:hypothetical protein
VSIRTAATATCLFAVLAGPAIASSTPAKPAAAKPLFDITFRPVRESNPVPIAVDVTEKDINGRARGYFGSVGRSFPAEELGKAGFGRSEDIRHVPYNRGSLYFADLDAKIRAGSQGTRKLDDVVFTFIELRKTKGTVDQNDWLELVTNEIGPSAREEWEAVNIRGELFVPDSNAFGPCFERRAKTYQVQGKDVDGYEWVRTAGVADATCRAW